MAAYRRDHAGEEPPLALSERARLRELERETRELKLSPEYRDEAVKMVIETSRPIARVAKEHLNMGIRLA